ncbi:MAG TPA: FAD:protein FMN transferase, partial [Cyclobacteriaceae bacterium]|nr:FAD:protein FMN transferase [Cyclobacteriaceae bacterium]
MEKLREFRKQARLMGSAFEFVIIAEQRSGEQLIEESITEVKRIESLLTEFSEDSVTSRINRSSGIAPIQVDDEVYTIIKRSNEISRLTQGAFDISSGILKKLYNFKGHDFTLPSREQIRDALRKTGYEKIQLLSDNRICLNVPGMRIAFGAIGKGYAADRVKQMLVRKGVKRGVINASGDLTAWGMRLDGTRWRIGIADPRNSTRPLFYIPIENASVATSGDYEQYFERDGIRYSHTIDPKSGHPVTGVKSVTVVS